MGQPPAPVGRGEVVRPPGADCPAKDQAAEAVKPTEMGGAVAITSRTEAVARPPEATGSQGEAARPGGEGGAGPSEPLLRIKNFLLRLIKYSICHFME